MVMNQGLRYGYRSFEPGLRGGYVGNRLGNRFGKQIGTLLISSGGNNVFVTFTVDINGRLHQFSSSLRHYEMMKGQKMTEHMLSSMMFKFLRDVKTKVRGLSWDVCMVHVVFKGSLWIRPGVLKSLTASKINLRSYSDATGVAHNGVRGKARRRV